MAKGKLRSGDTNNKHVSVSNSYKNGETYTSDFEINETSPSARTLLTKGYIQDEINSYSGATVSTRGRFMTEQEKSRCPNERPLYLFIQGYSKHNVDLAIQKIKEIIKTENQNSLNRPSRFTNAPPPLMSIQSNMTTVEKICIGIENAPSGFDLKGRIIGLNGANLLYIRSETGANVMLRGRNSQFADLNLGAGSTEPLHLFIEHPKADALQNAKQLAINLIQTIQSELQSYIQQQPPPVQSQQVVDQPQLQQAQFQTMNIGALGQPNVVTIQHQDIIQHPQSNVVTLPATILTATVASGPGSNVAMPPPGVHIPPHSGPLVPPTQTQEMQTLIPPPSVGQVQLIGSPSTVGQVQYQIHTGQPIHIQSITPCSQSSPQPVAQMYVMSQPPQQNPSQQNFISSTSSSVNNTVSYVYTQPNVQRPPTPSQGVIETMNLQQPPPIPNMNQQAPSSLLHLHFPPPNFPHNQPPPPIPQTYQIQYQQIQASQSQTQYLLPSGEQIVSSQLHTNQEPHIMSSQLDNHPSQYHLQVPPPTTQTFLVPNIQNPQHPQHHHHQHPPLSMNNEIHQQEGPPEQASLPQPVPPPQIVPPPSNIQLPNSMNAITNVPPPTQIHPQNAPWLFSTHPPQSQGQVQVPSTGLPLHSMPPPPMQAHVQYHSQPLHYQNGHVPPQVQYTLQPPPQHIDQKPSSPEQQKSHGVKRRFSEIDGSQDSPPYICGPHPAQRHGTGEGERRQDIQGQSTAGVGIPHGDRNKLLLPPPHPGDKRAMEHKSSRSMSDCGSVLENNPMQPVQNQQEPWQPPYARTPWDRPPPPREEFHPMGLSLPPTNMPPPQIRPRPPSDFTAKPPPYNTHPLMQSICNPPPPPPPHHQHRPQHHPQDYRASICQPYQRSAPCPPWMN